MGVIGCLQVTSEITELLRTEVGAASARTVAIGGPTVESVLASLSASLDEDAIELFRHELAELPGAILPAIVGVWSAASLAGKAFVLTSAPPVRLLQFARERRVELTTALDEHGVTVTVSHVPDRHAA